MCMSVQQRHKHNTIILWNIFLFLSLAKHFWVEWTYANPTHVLLPHPGDRTPAGCVLKFTTVLHHTFTHLIHHTLLYKHISIFMNDRIDPAARCKSHLHWATSQCMTGKNTPKLYEARLHFSMYRKNYYLKSTADAFFLWTRFWVYWEHLCSSSYK